jgi:glycosyltransferase involved in cell wall biosynthesis
VFCKLADSKVLLSRRDLGFNYSPAQLFLLKFNSLVTDCVAVNSKAVKAVVCRHENWASNDKVRVIYNGLSLSEVTRVMPSNLRQKLRIPPEAPIIGIVANFNPWKRHTDLMDAFHIVQKSKPNSHLVLVGDGPLKRTLQAKVEELRLTKSVHFTGMLNDVIPVIKEFTVAVLCSETEGFSNALLEYMACGKPVVATRTGGNLEIIEHGRNGFLIPVGEKERLANHILALLNDPDLRSKVGAEASRSIAAQFTFDRMITSYVSLYLELLNSPKTVNRGSFATITRRSQSP